MLFTLVKSKVSISANAFILYIWLSILLSSLFMCKSSVIIFIFLSVLILIRAYSQLLFIILGLEFLSLFSLVLLFLQQSMNSLGPDLIYIILGSLVLEASLGLSLLISVVRFQGKIFNVMK